jgi:hypothetical protein
MYDAIYDLHFFFPQFCEIEELGIFTQKISKVVEFKHLKKNSSFFQIPSLSEKTTKNCLRKNTMMMIQS